MVPVGGKTHYRVDYCCQGKTSLPSASALAGLRRQTAERRPAPETLAVFADPVVSQ